MIKSAIFFSAVAMILVIATVAQRRSQRQRVKLPLNPRSRLTSDDTQ